MNPFGPDAEFREAYRRRRLRQWSDTDVTEAERLREELEWRAESMKRMEQRLQSLDVMVADLLGRDVTEVAVRLLQDGMAPADAIDAAQILVSQMPDQRMPEN